jgi:site-specific recombinase XerD
MTTALIPAASTGTVADLAARWLGGLSAATRKGYSTDARQWFQWCAEHGVDPMHATSRDGAAWLAILQNFTPATRARKIAALSSLYAWLREEGVTMADPRPPKSARPRVKGENAARLVGLDAVSAARLMQAADQHSERMAALVALMLTTGLRVSEAVSLRPRDLATDGGGRTVATLTGKGERVRSVVVPPLAVERLVAIAPEEGGYYFRTRTGKQWSADEVRDALARLGERIGMAGLHPHALRHTAASLALASGTNIEAVRAMLGHSSLTTTQRYVKAAGALDGSPAYALAGLIAPRA